MLFFKININLDIMKYNYRSRKVLLNNGNLLKIAIAKSGNNLISSEVREIRTIILWVNVWAVGWLLWPILFTRGSEGADLSPESLVYGCAGFKAPSYPYFTLRHDLLQSVRWWIEVICNCWYKEGACTCTKPSDFGMVQLLNISRHFNCFHR